MQRRVEPNRRIGLWIEHIVWNAAAGAALAVMLLLLLGSLKWLDQIAPRATSPTSAVSAEAPARTGVSAADAPTEVAQVNRPSG
jgi:hypothetical protein